MDTLWGALPLATLPEQKFAARVGASLLAALGSSATVQLACPSTPSQPPNGAARRYRRASLR